VFSEKNGTLRPDAAGEAGRTLATIALLGAIAPLGAIEYLDMLDRDVVSS